MAVAIGGTGFDRKARRQAEPITALPKDFGDVLHRLLAVSKQCEQAQPGGFPGGAQHLGETAEEAARRELREETGLVPSDPGFRRAARSCVINSTPLMPGRILSTNRQPNPSGRATARNDSAEGCSTTLQPSA